MRARPLLTAQGTLRQSVPWDFKSSSQALVWQEVTDRTWPPAGPRAGPWQSEAPCLFFPTLGTGIPTVLLDQRLPTRQSLETGTGCGDHVDTIWAYLILLRSAPPK